MSVDFSARGRNAPSCRLGVAVGRFERRVLKGTRAALFAAMADARSWAGNWNETGVAVSHTHDRNYCSNKARNVSDIAEVSRIVGGVEVGHAGARFTSLTRNRSGFPSPRLVSRTANMRSMKLSALCSSPVLLVAAATAMAGTVQNTNPSNGLSNWQSEDTAFSLQLLQLMPDNVRAV